MQITQTQLDSVQLYLARHGQHVTSLSLDGPFALLRQLPACSQLRSLHLDHMPAQLGASSSHLGVLQAVPQLTRLHVSWAHLLDTDGSALTAALATLTGLQRLDLNLWGKDLPKVEVSALTQLQLTHLELSTRLLEVDGDGTLPRLNSLAQLRVLHLSAVGLAVNERRHAVPAGAFSGLQHLTQLVVANGSMHPGALAGIPQLQHLRLEKMAATGEEEGAAAFLHDLEQLQRLSHLELDGTLQHAAPPAAAYSALTASSLLQRLQLTDCELPPRAWQHIFGRQRPALRELFVRDFDPPRPRGVKAMVSACPGLQGLTLDWPEDSTAAPQPQQASQLLAPLSGLLQLTSLFVNHVDDAAAGAALAQLSGLRSLALETAHLSMAGLLALAELRGLTYLYAYSGAFEYSLTDQAPVGAPPDVWRQVLEHCQGCDDPVVRLAVQQAAATEARLYKLQQQAAGLQQQLAEQAAQHSAELAAVKRQLAEQASALAQLLQRL